MAETDGPPSPSGGRSSPKPRTSAAPPPAPPPPLLPPLLPPDDAVRTGSAAGPATPAPPSASSTTAAAAAAAAASAGRGQPPKNKACPFCGERFTSSSLGRHLDLYIRPRNPKPPDGRHDVAAIRELRGGITRRRAKRSLPRGGPDAAEAQLHYHESGGGGGGGGGRDAHGAADGGSPHEEDDGSTPKRSRTGSLTAAGRTPAAAANGLGFRSVWQRPAWQISGVMTDVPPLPNDEAAAAADDYGRPAGAGARAPEAETVSRRRLAAEQTRRRAAELALQELVDSVNAANAQEHPPAPFDFDFLGQSFPALCLRLLPPPPTLHAGQVVESPDAWPVAPPAPLHHERVRARVEERLEAAARARVRHHAAHARHPRHDSDASSAGAGVAPFRPVNGTGPPRPRPRNLDPALQAATPDADDEPEAADRTDTDYAASRRASSSVAAVAAEDLAPYRAHLDRAAAAWHALPKPQREQQWHLEALRAAARERAEAEAAREALREARADAAHLRAQLRRLSECQQPREFLAWPAARVPITGGAATAAAAVAVGGGDDGDVGGADDNPVPGELSGEALVAKWAARVQSMPPPPAQGAPGPAVAAAGGAELRAADPGGREAGGVEDGEAMDVDAPLGGARVAVATGPGLGR